MSKTFLISDTHFGHRRIMEYEDRPFESVIEMDKTIIKNWNKVVTGEDTVIVAGDVSFYGKKKTTEIIKRLKGNKILVLGNHDKRSIQYWMDIGFSEVYRYPIVYMDWFVVGHGPPHFLDHTTPYFYLYGHVHGAKSHPTITRQTACVCVERWDYTPVELETIMEMARMVGDEMGPNFLDEEWAKRFQEYKRCRNKNRHNDCEIELEEES